MNFTAKLEAAITKNNSLLCIGLDPDERVDPNMFEFNKSIIDATADLVCAYKPNSAFYEARGADGLAELKQTCDYLCQNHSDIPIILDFKRGDIGHTNEGYARLAFDYLGVDAVTIQPYLGREAVQPFLNYKDKGIIVLCRTSNEGAGEFQDLETDGQKIYLKVAQSVAKQWNANGNCLLVVGATSPAEMAEVRQTVGDDMYFLVPGVGAQGGDIKAVLKAGGEHLIINSSRSIIYSDDPRTVATVTRDEINQHRSQP